MTDQTDDERQEMLQKLRTQLFGPSNEDPDADRHSHTPPRTPREQARMYAHELFRRAR